MKNKYMKIICILLLVLTITFQFPVKSKALSIGDIFKTGSNIFKAAGKFLSVFSKDTGDLGQYISNFSELLEKYDQEGFADLLSKVAGFVGTASQYADKANNLLSKLPSATLEKLGISQEHFDSLKDVYKMFSGLDGESVFKLPSSIKEAKNSLSNLSEMATILENAINSSNLSAEDKQTAMNLLQFIKGLIKDFNQALTLTDKLDMDKTNELDKLLGQVESEDVLYVYKFERDKDPSEYNFSATNLDDIITRANGFLVLGNSSDSKIIDADRLQSVSNFVSGVLLAIAIAVTLISAVVMAIKFFVESVDDKAKIKEAMTPWIIGILVSFGAFGIWEITINIFNKL